MGINRYIFCLLFLVQIILNICDASPIKEDLETTTEKPTMQGKYFGEIMKELNEALKEKAAEERQHINLLMNMTAEMRKLSEQVRGMQDRLKKITGK